MQKQQLEETLRQMGIDPQNIGKKSTLPDLPPSDPASLQRNTYDGFYKVGARDFWQHSQITQNKIDDFKKCIPHALIQRRNEAYCTKCHVGWILPTSMHVQDGKLFNAGTEFQFQ